MRKIYFAALLLLVSTFAGQLSAQCGSLFYDGFESGTYTPTWTNGGGSYTRTVVNGGAAVGNYFFQMTGGSSTHLNGTYASFANVQPDYASWYVRTANPSSASGYVVIGEQGIGSANNSVCFQYFTNGNLCIYNSGTVQYTVPAVPNQWYHIELRNINYINKNYDLYVDGILVYPAYPFRSPTLNGIGAIHLYNFGNTTAGWDQISLGGLPLISNLSGQDLQCYGDQTGAATTSAVGGSGSYVYQWSTGDTTSNISGLSPGTYMVTITDISDSTCFDTASVTLMEPSAIMDSVDITMPLCNGGSDGSINAMISGGTPGYTYLWNTGDSTQSLAGIMAGDYVLTVTDSAGCTFVDSVSLAEPSAVMILDSISDVLCNGDGNGSILAMGMGGTPGYTYNWSTGDTTDMIAGLSGGTYGVTVTDANGCSSADSIMVNEPGVIVSSGSVTNDVGGLGNGAIDYTVSGGVGGFSFSWSNGANTEDISGLTAGTYTVTATDLNGCTVVDSFTVEFVVSVQNLKAFGVSVAPNPTAGQLNIVANGEAAASLSIELLDIAGKRLQMENLDFSQGSIHHALNLSSYPAGVYFLHISNGEQVQTLKVVRQ